MWAKYEIRYQRKDKISTINHMFGRVIRDKLPECIFKIFEIVQVKRRQFQNYRKSVVIYPKNRPTQTCGKPTNTLH